MCVCRSRKSNSNMRYWALGKVAGSFLMRTGKWRCISGKRRKMDWLLIHSKRNTACGVSRPMKCAIISSVPMFEWSGNVSFAYLDLQVTTAYVTAPCRIVLVGWSHVIFLKTWRWSSSAPMSLGKYIACQVLPVYPGKCYFFDRAKSRKITWIVCGLSSIIHAAWYADASFRLDENSQRAVNNGFHIFWVPWTKANGDRLLLASHGVERISKIGSVIGR